MSFAYPQSFWDYRSYQKSSISPLIDCVSHIPLRSVSAVWNDICDPGYSASDTRLLSEQKKKIRIIFLRSFLSSSVKKRDHLILRAKKKWGERNMQTKSVLWKFFYRSIFFLQQVLLKISNLMLLSASWPEKKASALLMKSDSRNKNANLTLERDVIN